MAPDNEISKRRSTADRAGTTFVPGGASHACIMSMLNQLEECGVTLKCDGKVRERERDR